MYRDGSASPPLHGHNGGGRDDHSSSSRFDKEIQLRMYRTGVGNELDWILVGTRTDMRGNPPRVGPRAMTATVTSPFQRCSGSSVEL